MANAVKRTLGWFPALLLALSSYSNTKKQLLHRCSLGQEFVQVCETAALTLSFKR